MLKTVWLTEQQNIQGGTALLLGGFDGLHIGHRRLLAFAKEYGLPVGVMTIVGGKDGEALFTLSEREEIFKNKGVDFTFELSFSQIKDLSPEDFLGLLEENFSPKLFVCGEDFRFGVNASGTPKTLEKATRVRVEVLPLLEWQGEKVSARGIKERVKQGEVEEACACLGERFFLLGEVYKDRGIGKTLGFPTANIRYPKGKCPLKKGVYETRVSVDGIVYKGITNYGSRPTFDDETVVTDSYLDGFNGDLYGRVLKVEFVRFLREIEKFDSVEDLKKQLKKDIERVRTND
ncbi:MAG: hypothetical protein IKZ28_05275 [Clostridia bacterium]|nr:hypothetical protein [Clostridia bacterium]